MLNRTLVLGQLRCGPFLFVSGLKGDTQLILSGNVFSRHSADTIWVLKENKPSSLTRDDGPVGFQFWFSDFGIVEFADSAVRLGEPI